MCIMLFTLHNYDLKVPNFTFVEGMNQDKTLFSFSWTLIQCYRIQVQKNLPTFVELMSWYKLNKAWSSATSLCNRQTLLTTLELSEPIFKVVIIINWKGLLFFVILEKPLYCRFCCTKPYLLHVHLNILFKGSWNSLNFCENFCVHVCCKFGYEIPSFCCIYTFYLGLSLIKGWDWNQEFPLATMKGNPCYNNKRTIRSL